MLLTAIRHTSAKTSIDNYNILTFFLLQTFSKHTIPCYTCYISSSKTTHYTYVHKRTCTGCSVDST